MRGEIARAGGREVCFLATVTEDRQIVDPRAVARGNHAAVLAAARGAPAGGIMLHNHPSGRLEPSDADLAVASQIYETGLGTGIVDNRAQGLYVVVEPPAPRVVEPLDIAELETFASPGGPLSRIHNGYEDRPGQREMLARVADGYNEGGIVVVEAGTGTGKTVAYLLPAVRWAIQNGQRTVISTNTINLQEQLVDKDLPLVRRTLGEDFRWALVKGRRNYISIRRARLAAESAGVLFEDDRSQELSGLLDWIGTTEDGSLADLAAPPSSDVWEEVQSDPDICLRARCPHFQACFYQRSRRDASAADVLVVNHHLLFTDLSVRRATDNFTQSAVLPPYQRLILDEAHNVEDAATSHLGVDLTRSGIFRTLARLDRNGKGVLTAIHDRLRAAPQGEERTPLLLRVENRVRPALDDARAHLALFFDALEDLVPPDESAALRLGSERLPEPIDKHGVRERLEGVLGALALLAREVSELITRIDLAGEWRESLQGRTLDLQSIERRLQGASTALRLVLDPEQGGGAYVRWMERRGSARRKDRSLALAAAPIEPGPILRESLFAKVETSVLTSATLTTRKSFDFLRGRLGIASSTLTLADPDEELRVVEASIESPFDYAAQTVLCVPADLGDPSPGEGGSWSDPFQAETSRVLEAFADLSGGGLFALFTSYRALRKVAEALRTSGVSGRWPLFVQGEDTRARLLGRFVDSGNGILLGTSSFWEGVDVPGRPLRGLLIQKLPFRVPTEPITEARVEAIEEAGGNPFWDFVLPLAALRLKQGFGRLVRSRQDRGAVVLLDRRILTRRYGRYLRESLPEAPVMKGPWWEIEKRLRDFYAAP